VDAVMNRNRSNSLVLALVLVGVASFAYARMESAAERTIPYQGVLEQNGAAANGIFAARFGLFPTDTEDTSCVVTNDCPLWSEEQDIEVVNGRFSVVLGDGDGPTTLSDTVLASQSLFLATALKGEQDAEFTALAGVNEIVPVPHVARAVTADRAALVNANGVNNAAIQGGAVTRDKLGTDARFILAARHTGGDTYVIDAIIPSAWFGIPLIQSADQTQIFFFTNVLPGVGGYACTGTSSTPGVTVSVQVASLSQINIFLRDSANNPVDASFTVRCDAL
jgi:hypothetical protein